jgi:cell division protein FtsL
MTRLNIVLLLAVVLSALFLVHTEYESRRLTMAREQANARQKRLLTEQDQLAVEKRAQATPSRVERLARERLAMQPATPAVTQYVKTYTSSAVEGGGQP